MSKGPRMHKRECKGSGHRNGPTKALIRKACQAATKSARTKARREVTRRPKHMHVLNDDMVCIHDGWRMADAVLSGADFRARLVDDDVRLVGRYR